MANQKIMFSVTDEAVELLMSNAGPRKRGLAVSKAVIAYYTGQPAQDKPASDGGILERIEQRLARIEAALSGK